MTRLGSPFRRLYAASATANLADGIGRAALPLAAASYTRNPLAISGLASFAFLPWLLFALPSGVLVDRVDRRHAMAAANVVRAVAIAVLAGLLVCGAGSVAALYAVAFALGAAETVYDSAVRALLAQVVTAGELDRANSLLTVEETLGQTFVGAPVGSLLFAAAVALPFLVNTAGFVVAAVLIVSVRGSFRPERRAARGVRTEIADGVRWLRSHRLLRSLTILSAGTAFALNLVNGVFVLYVLDVLALPARSYGLVLLVGGAGGLLGGLATPPLTRRLGRPTMLTAGATLTAISTMTMAATTDAVLGTALFAMSAASVMVWNVLTMSLRQAVIPPGLFGRVQGAYRTVVWGAIPLGALTGGALATAAGIRTVFAVAGALLLVLAVLLGRLLRRHRHELVDDFRGAVPGPAAQLDLEPATAVSRGRGRSGCADGGSGSASA